MLVNKIADPQTLLADLPPLTEVERKILTDILTAAYRRGGQPFNPVTEPPPDFSALRSPPYGLTAREVEVAEMIFQGMTNKLIGRRLQISPRTVEVHRARALQKT